MLDGRVWEREEVTEELEGPDTLYADDTGEFFRLRAHAEKDVPRLVKFLARFGLFVHVARGTWSSSARRSSIQCCCITQRRRLLLHQLRHLRR